LIFFAALTLLDITLLPRARINNRNADCLKLTPFQRVGAALGLRSISGAPDYTASRCLHISIGFVRTNLERIVTSLAEPVFTGCFATFALPQVTTDGRAYSCAALYCQV
jgi:hypothetical protein